MNSSSNQSRSLKINTFKIGHVLPVRNTDVEVPYTRTQRNCLLQAVWATCWLILVTTLFLFPFCEVQMVQMHLVNCTAYSSRPLPLSSLCSVQPTSTMYTLQSRLSCPEPLGMADGAQP